MARRTGEDKVHHGHPQEGVSSSAPLQPRNNAEGKAKGHVCFVFITATAFWFLISIWAVRRRGAGRRGVSTGRARVMRPVRGVRTRAGASEAGGLLRDGHYLFLREAQACRP